MSERGEEGWKVEVRNNRENRRKIAAAWKFGSSSNRSKCINVLIGTQTVYTEF